jgi:hypothetical protein
VIEKRLGNLQKVGLAKGRFFGFPAWMAIRGQRSSKKVFFERPPDRTTSSAPKAQSSVRLSVRVATAHSRTSTHGRARLNLPLAPDFRIADQPDSIGVHLND